MESLFFIIAYYGAHILLFDFFIEFILISLYISTEYFGFFFVLASKGNLRPIVLRFFIRHLFKSKLISYYTITDLCT